MGIKYIEINTINDQVYNVNTQIVQVLRGSKCWSSAGSIFDAKGNFLSGYHSLCYWY